MPAAVVGTVPAAVVAQTGASIAVTMPTHRTGDLLLIFVVTRSTTAWSPSNSFVVIEQANGTNLSVGLIAKIATSAAETCTITVGSDDWCAQAIRVAYHGCKVASLSTDILKGTAATATSTTADPPSVTYGTTNDWLTLAIAGLTFTGVGDTVSVVPSGFTSVVLTKSGASTTSVGMGVAWIDDPASSSRNPGTFTNTSSVWLAQTYAIPNAAYMTWQETWDGTNGAAWPTPWVTSVVGTGSVTIQTNKGRLLTSATAEDRARGLRNMPNTDGIWYAEYLYAATPAYQELVLEARAAGNWNNSGYSSDSGYSFSMNTTDTSVYGAAGAQIATAAFSVTLSNTYALKAVILGTTLRMRCWNISGAEPTTWNINFTDAGIATGGFIQLRNKTATTTAADNTVDNLKFYDLGYLPVRPGLVVSQAIRRSSIF